MAPVLFAAACFLTYSRRMDMHSHPAAHTSQFSARATASCSLCNPFKATAAALLATTAGLFDFQQTARAERKEHKNGDGEMAVNVNGPRMLVGAALTYSDNVMVGKVVPTQPRVCGGTAASRRVRPCTSPPRASQA